MTIKKRVNRLEERQSAEEMVPRLRLNSDDLWLHLGLDPDELRAEQKERAAQGENLCIAEIVAEKMGVTFAAFKAILKKRVRG